MLTLGLGIAALAGIPALIENRSVGDVVVVVGLAVALAGGVVLLTGIPGQRRARDEVRRVRQAQIDDAMTKRERILAQQALANAQHKRVTSSIRMRMTIGASGDEREHFAEARALEVELINLDAELAMNANELRRLGIEVSEPSA